MNFHIISAYNSEISSELSKYSEWAQKKIRNCPNTPNDLGKKFEIVRILRIDLRIKVGNYHPYSENIVRFGNYSKLALRKFLH
jgi:hypothetical protein